MNYIKGILFDKDGTLLDFNSIWVPAAEALIEELMENFSCKDKNSLKREMLESIGVWEGRIDHKGILAGGTVQDIAETFQQILEKKQLQTKKIEKFIEKVEQKLYRIIKEKVSEIKPTRNLNVLFKRLKDRGIQIGLATSDGKESTEFCLKQLGVYHYFCFIGTYEQFLHPKPHPQVLYSFCEVCGIRPEEVVVVGDTIVDLTLARNGKAALAVGVLSGTSSRKDLEPLADLLLNSVEELIDEQGIFAWSRKRTRK